MEKRPCIETKHSEIAAYWMNKYIHPDGTVTKDKGHDGILVCLDIYEPECFICGKSPMNSPQFSLKRYEKLIKSDDPLNVWNIYSVKATLEKAHIIPYALGGKDTPSNLVCLCHRCHKNAPNTNDYNSFIRHLYKEKTSGRFALGISIETLEKIYDIMLESGLTLEEIARFGPNDYLKALTPVDDMEMTVHFGENVNESTLMGSFRKSIEKYASEIKKPKSDT